MKQTVLRYLPNIITFLRIVAVGPVAWLLWVENYMYALLVFAVAGVSDGVDGYLARRFNWKSHWGAVMDPMADKLLMVATATVLMFKDILPLWLYILIFLRDSIIVIGAAIYRFKFGPFKVQPTTLGKLSTFVQILMVLSLLLHASTGLLSNGQILVMINLCGLITVLSGIQYVTIWLRKALNE